MGERPPRVCVVGSVNMDLVVRAPRIPTPGETIMGRSFDTFPGGKGANQAVAAARLGASVALLGCVGNEAHGHQLARTLHDEGIDLSRMLQRRDKTPTGVALIIVDDAGENTIVVAPGANLTLTAADIEDCRDVIESCDVLLLQLETPIDAVAMATKIAREAGKAIILNASPALAQARDVLRQCDLLIVNRTEAATMGGLEQYTEPGRLALRLAEIGPPTIVLTLGSQGAVMTHKGRPKRIPTLAVKAVDAVGAGDAFAGALATAYASVHAAAKAKSPEEFRLLERAMAFASAAGALATLKPGAIPSLPTLDEVLPRVAELEKQMRF
ncbi:MAG: ribokinase [Planctomycetota bacterium]